VPLPFVYGLQLLSDIEGCWDYNTGEHDGADCSCLAIIELSECFLIDHDSHGLRCIQRTSIGNQVVEVETIELPYTLQEKGYGKNRHNQWQGDAEELPDTPSTINRCRFVAGCINTLHGSEHHDHHERKHVPDIDEKQGEHRYGQRSYSPCGVDEKADGVIDQVRTEQEIIYRTQGFIENGFPYHGGDYRWSHPRNKEYGPEKASTGIGPIHKNGRDDSQYCCKDQGGQRPKEGIAQDLPELLQGENPCEIL